jgi:hypothetical protein
LVPLSLPVSLEGSLSIWDLVSHPNIAIIAELIPDLMPTDHLAFGFLDILPPSRSPLYSMSLMFFTSWPWHGMCFLHNAPMVVDRWGRIHDACQKACGFLS